MSFCIQYNYQFAFILALLAAYIHYFPLPTVSEIRQLRDSFFVFHFYSEVHT